MSKIDWACLGFFILGFVLFLLGANISLWGGTAAQSSEYYAVGYTGLYMFIGSIIAYLIFYTYKELTKKTQTAPAQKP